MKLRTTIYWLISLLVLTLLLTQGHQNKDPKNQQATVLTSHIKGIPSAFYFIDNQFTASVIGQLKLVIKTSEIEPNFTDYNALVVENFLFKQHIETSLNWSVNNQPHQMILNQSKHSINRIDFKTDDADEITDMHLLMTSKQELGINKSLQDEIKFSSIRLDYLNKLNPIKTDYSEWSDLNQVEFSSINGYSNSSNLYLKSLLVKTIYWLLFSIVLHLICRINGTHLIATLMIAWLFGGYFFITNHYKQHKQIVQSFSADQKHLNRIDQKVHELAQRISETLNASPSLMSSADRLVIMASNSFQKLRLRYYLLSTNSALGFDIEELLLNQQSSDFVYLLTAKQRLLCNNTPENNWLLSQVVITHTEDDFCLLRKK